MIPHASSRKGTRQTHIKIDAAPTPPITVPYPIESYRQVRVFVAQADLYTLSYSNPLKDIDNFLHTSTPFPFSLKGVMKLTDYQPPSSPAAAAAQVDSHTHLFPAAPCNQDNTISRGGKVCRLLSYSYRGGETTLCRTAGIVSRCPPSSIYFSLAAVVRVVGV